MSSLETITALIMSNKSFGKSINNTRVGFERLTLFTCTSFIMPGVKFPSVIQFETYSSGDFVRQWIYSTKKYSDDGTEHVDR